MKTSFEPRFARAAAMIGDPTRARMLASLLDGALMTAGEIARSAGVTPQTASGHLNKLLDAELVAVRTQGRHRYFRLADGDVAHALEALALVGDKDDGERAVRTVWSREAMKPLRHARSCYGHLAGCLGVRLHDALVERDIVTLDDGVHRLGEAGPEWLARIGFDAASVTPTSRGIAYPCVDWSERRDHFAGPLAVGLLEHFLAQRWLTRVGTTRALAVGPKSHAAFDALLGGIVR